MSELTNYFKYDTLTGCIAQVEYEHREIHAGGHYVASFISTLAVSATADFLFRTGTKSLHLTGNVNSDQAGRVYFYEGGTMTANGATFASFNNNRNSSNTSTCAIFSGPTVSDAGTQIFCEASGGRKQSGFIDRNREFVLRPNEVYMFRYMSDVASNTVSGVFEWYEESNY